jgi:hypothetical protein
MKRMNGCKKNLVELLSMLRKAWWVCFLQSRVHMEKSKSNKKRQRRRQSGRMVAGMTPWSFYQ